MALGYTSNHPGERKGCVWLGVFNVLQAGKIVTVPTPYLRKGLHGPSGLRGGRVTVKGLVKNEKTLISRNWVMVPVTLMGRSPRDRPGGKNEEGHQT